MGGLGDVQAGNPSRDDFSAAVSLAIFFRFGVREGMREDSGCVSRDILAKKLDIC